MKEIEDQIRYWTKSAAHDLKTAESLFQSRHYDWCLFLGHLVLEKLLKAHYVKDNREFPPKIHKLEIIAGRTRLILPPEKVDFLKEINEFNIATRYPDWKFSFYKLCKKPFAARYFREIKRFAGWLQKEML